MSFRLKTIIGIALIELVLLSILIVSAQYHLRTSSETQLKNRAVATARILASMISDSVVSADIASLNTVVEEVLKTPDIAYVRFSNRNGIELAQGGVRSVVAGNPTSSGAAHIVGNIVGISFPVEVVGRTFGYVELGIYAGDIATTLWESAGWLLGVAALEIGLVALFGIALGNILLAQLKELQSGAKRVAGGEVGFQIPVRGTDELAETAHSFNAMSKSLARTAESLKKARALAEERRALAESTLHDAIASLSDGIVIADPASKHVQVNNAFHEMHANALDDRKDFTLRSLDEAVAPGIAAAVEGAATIESLRTADPDRSRKSFGSAFENAINGKRWTVRFEDGKTYMYATSGMTNGGIVIVATDMTAIYQAEERAQKMQQDAMQGQKLEAIGTLAGGIAHELNTPIQFIGDNLSFIGDACAQMIDATESYGDLLNDLASGPVTEAAIAARREALERVDFEFTRDELPQAIAQSADGIRQMANIVLAMKEFAHPASKERSSIDVNRALERAVLVSRNEWKYVAEVERGYGDPAPNALVNEGELNQVLLNIIVNAAQAIQEAEREKGKIELRTRDDGKNVVIEIEDNGIGIPEAIRHRIFDQFFTTKGVGKGTGQGLALCNEFITKRNGGKMSFNSVPGVGTTFVIELPKAEDAVRLVSSGPGVSSPVAP